MGILIQTLAAIFYVGLVAYPALGLLGVYRVPFIPYRFVKKTDNVFTEMTVIILLCSVWLVILSFLA